MIQVSRNRRYLVRSTGEPFFWLGDTAWELFHRLDREAADRYLRLRARQEFTVIQAVALAELNGLTDPNPYGHLPLHHLDPARPNEAYFEHVDWIVDRAAELGLRIALLPTWGDKWNRRWGVGPEIFTPENAETYGAFLGARYRERPVFWVLGGDRLVENGAQLEITRAMARGLRRGDGGRHLMTFHPTGLHSSAESFHAEGWLDFNMCQTGHARDSACYRALALDYARLPTRPCLNGEPGYEHIPDGLKVGRPLHTDADVRRYAYWSLFAGAHGHTYGCNEVWQMWEPGRDPVIGANRPWHEVLELPGAWQMRFARRLLESRPVLARVPDPALLVDPPSEPERHAEATRARDGAYAMVYLPRGGEIRVDLSRLSGRSLRASWYDPRSGRATELDPVPASGEREFTAPSEGEGEDWVLVLDDAARRFPPPGQVG